MSNCARRPPEMREFPTELERQFSQLSDGDLSAEDARRLNTLLKEDPISQEAYLDHLMLEALLESEWTGTLPATSGKTLAPPLAPDSCGSIRSPLPSMPTLRNPVRTLRSFP